MDWFLANKKKAKKAAGEPKKKHDCTHKEGFEGIENHVFVMAYGSLVFVEPVTQGISTLVKLLCGLLKSYRGSLKELKDVVIERWRDLADVRICLTEGARVEG